MKHTNSSRVGNKRHNAEHSNHCESHTKLHSFIHSVIDNHNTGVGSEKAESNVRSSPEQSVIKQTIPVDRGFKEDSQMATAGHYSFF